MLPQKNGKSKVSGAEKSAKRWKSPASETLTGPNSGSEGLAKQVHVYLMGMYVGYTCGHAHRGQRTTWWGEGTIHLFFFLKQGLSLPWNFQRRLGLLASKPRDLHVFICNPSVWGLQAIYLALVFIACTLATKLTHSCYGLNHLFRL